MYGVGVIPPQRHESAAPTPEDLLQPVQIRSPIFSNGGQIENAPFEVEKGTVQAEFNNRVDRLCMHALVMCGLCCVVLCCVCVCVSECVLAKPSRCEVSKLEQFNS
jgi:hypothetical protein